MQGGDYGELGGSLSAIASLNASYSTSLTLPSPYLLVPPAERKAVSDVRRTFCLFVTFDLLFITLLWIIELNVTGTLLENLEDQVVRYNFKSSFFDIVVLALFRFLCLQIGYAAFRLKHWWVVAVSQLRHSKIHHLNDGNISSFMRDINKCSGTLQVSTLVTSVFLVVKVIISEVSTLLMQHFHN
ncbi:StAR- lipid transfer protein 3 [Xenoophorus captivus]|uniref:StAR- lipid transfer protein 3 n=1 Tax=Xenoophorus captivus TaxID=1517983 RepID=A0ABV0S616_9TELE